MRTIRNLTWFLFAFALTVFSGLAFAAPTVQRYTLASDFPDQSFESPDAACEALIQKVNAAGGNASCRPPHTTSQIRWANPTSRTTQLGRINLCADGSPPNMSMPLDQRCPDPDEEPPPSCKAGEGGDYTWKYEYSPWGKPNDGSCDLKCEYEVKECFSRPNSSNPNQIYCTYPCAKNGNAKSSSDGSDTSGDGKGPGDKRDDVPPMNAPPGGGCPKGTVQMGVNLDGVPRCVGTGSEPKNPPPAPPKTQQEDTQQNPDGSTTTTTTTTTSNADGSTTTVVSKTTTGTDGKKTTTESRDTTKSPTGNSGKDDSKKDDEKYDLCKQNPHLTICQNSSVAGKCGEISCQGDAIQCATLRAAAAMQCQQAEDIDALSKSPSTTLGNSILSGNDPMKGAIDQAMTPKEIDLSQEKLDNQGFLGGGTCLKPITINLPGGNSYTQTFDVVCQEIQPLRYVIMFMAYVSAYMIVVRTVLGS